MSKNIEIKEKEINDIIKNINLLSRSLAGLGDSFYQVSNIIGEISSSSIHMIDSLSQISESIKNIKPIDTALNIASGSNNIGSSVANAIPATGADASSVNGNNTSGGKGLGLLGGILGGIGAASGVVGGIIGIFRRRREEEKKYRREMEKALYAQLSAETELAMATATRLADEKAITREKYKQLEAAKNTGLASKKEVLSDIERAIREAEEKLEGRYSSGYKRTERDFLDALLKLKNNAGDLDWLESVGDNPLMASSNEHYDQYMSYYNSLLSIARAQEDWKKSQEELIEETIGSTANDLVESWIEAFEKGEEATWDFAQNFQEVMRNAVINGFAQDVILSHVKPIFDSFKEKVADYLAGKLELEDLVTPELESQIDKTRDKIKEISPELSKILEKLGLEVGNSSSSTLSASIKGVSEETASAVAGQMNAIRSNQVKSLEYLTESIVVMNKIESNTRYCRHLQSIDHRIESLCSSLSVNMSRI